MSARTKKELMAAVAVANVNTIPVAPSDTPESFVETVATWLGGWWRLKSKWQAISPGYSAIVLDPDFGAAHASNGFALIQMFRDTPAKTLGGAIYVTDSVMGKVYRKSGQFADANALICGLRTAGLADRPLVMFDPEAGITVLAKAGINAPYMPLPALDSFDAELTVTNVDKLLDQLYETTLKFPTTLPHVWFNSEKHIPIFQAEKMYQSIALIHLRASAQNNWVVRAEEETNAGYPDLAISSVNPRRTFVFEIKVLKSFRYNIRGASLVNSHAKNVEWASEGIQQARDYRGALAAIEAFLLLYDMRKNDADITVITKRCTTEKVQHRRYFIHNQSATAIRKSKKK